MWVFCRGWRRKLGVLTLLLACLFFVMYLRSRVVADGVAAVPSTHQQEWYYSADGFLGWQSYETTLAGYTPSPWFSYGTIPIKPGEFFDPDSPGDVQWRSRWFGGGIGEFPTETVRTVSGSGTVAITLRYISYWCFIVPLTALSAYLILSQPQKLGR
ncbi:MAG TPA: hypothetical protein VGM98_13660 [Schlesneria sp.]|jgi:hypothetical protein